MKQKETQLPGEFMKEDRETGVAMCTLKPEGTICCQETHEYIMANIGNIFDTKQKREKIKPCKVARDALTKKPGAFTISVGKTGDKTAK